MHGAVKVRGTAAVVGIGQSHHKFIRLTVFEAAW